MLNIETILGTLFFAAILYFFWSLNTRTKRAIDKWAEENSFTILARKYCFWYWFVPGLMGGFHPANFKVLVESKNGNVDAYRITGGGFFWLSDKIQVKKVNIKTT
jgi:hypothetical protein